VENFTTLTLSYLVHKAADGELGRDADVSIFGKKKILR